MVQGENSKKTGDLTLKYLKSHEIRPFSGPLAGISLLGRRHFGQERLALPTIF
jgi:hypothetical protein